MAVIDEAMDNPTFLVRLATDRTVWAGDFNLPMLKPRPLQRTLTATLDQAGLTVATAGPWPELADQWPLIDHIAVSSALAVSDIRVWGRHVAGEDRRITDRAGVSLTVGP